MTATATTRRGRARNGPGRSDLLRSGRRNPRARLAGSGTCGRAPRPLRGSISTPWITSTAFGPGGRWCTSSPLLTRASRTRRARPRPARSTTGQPRSPPFGRTRPWGEPALRTVVQPQRLSRRLRSCFGEQRSTEPKARGTACHCGVPLGTLMRAAPVCDSLVSPSAAGSRVSVSAGQALFIPAGWWHEVFTHELTVSSNAWLEPPPAARLRPPILFLSSDSFERFRRGGEGEAAPAAPGGRTTDADADDASGGGGGGNAR